MDDEEWPKKDQEKMAVEQQRIEKMGGALFSYNGNRKWCVIYGKKLFK